MKIVPKGTMDNVSVSNYQNRWWPGTEQANKTLTETMITYFADAFMRHKDSKCLCIAKYVANNYMMTFISDACIRHPATMS